jgi:serine/threonine-protein kinase RsbW
MSGTGSAGDDRELAFGREEEAISLGPVNLSFPARAELFVMARMTASAVASRCDFAVEDIDDLRLAIDEMCAVCMEDANEKSRIDLSYTWDGTCVDVHCSVAPVDERAGPAFGLDTLETERSALARVILAALVDEYGIGNVEQGTLHAWLRKARASTGQ